MLSDHQVASLRRLMELRVDRDEKKQAAEDAERAYREKESEVWDELEEGAVVGSLKVDLGPPFGKVTFLATETFYGNVYDKNAALDFFEQSARVDEMTEVKISAKELNSLVRGRIEANQEMPPGIDWKPRRGVRITRPKG